MHTRTHVPSFPFNAAAVLNALERSIAQVDTGSYPPFNIIEDGDNGFTIELAVAGFSEEQIKISLEKRVLTVEAEAVEEDADRTFHHKGIAQRAFRRTFRLGEHVEVRGASMTNGLLVIKLERVVPEDEQPKRIEITRQ